MDPITAMAASGLRARMESLDLLANNSPTLPPAATRPTANSTACTPRPKRAGRRLIRHHAGDRTALDRPSQGVLQTTGNPLDVALSGKGFFAVHGPSGPLYTRNGSFHLAADGKLVTADGYPVRSAAGAR